MADALHFVDANGLKFAYLEEGTGPLVLMLHGFPDTAHTWDDLRSRIAAKGYRAVSPFMRGYHPTAIPDRDADQETLARDALALIDALGASEAVVIGHDFGAGGRLRRGGAGPRSSNEAVRSRHSPPGRAQAVAETALGRPPLRGLQVAGGTEPLRAQRLRGAARDLQAMVAGLGPDPKEFDPVRASFSNRASLNAAFGYYRKLSPIPCASLKTRITVPTVVFAGLGDPIAKPADYRGAARMFDGDYIVEEVARRAFHAPRAPRYVRGATPRSSVIGTPPRLAAIVLGLCPKWIVAP